MTHAAFVVAGYLLVAVVLGAYALAVVLGGRRLSRRVPPEERRWM